MSSQLLEFARLAPLGLFVGAFGTLVGAGGGSILVPILLILLPEESPATITAMSLAVVFFNAYSGTISYVRIGRIDYRAGVLFTLSGLPCAVLGALLVHEIPRAFFDPVFGVLLVALAGVLAATPTGVVPSNAENTGEAEVARRDLHGSIGSAYIAVLSSLLGIGGGIIHVPFLVRVLKFPAHTAVATSHFVLTFIALAGTLTHVAIGEFERGLDQTAFLAIGVMMGAPLGAALSSRLKGSVIIRLLALALGLVGVRLLARLL